MPVSRLRLRDLQYSRLPDVLGICAADTARIAQAVNSAQERLLTCREAGDTGWYGGYAEMVFSVATANPYLTLPRSVARLIRLDACTRPVPLQNQFYEYLSFGSGRWPKVASSTQSVCATGQTQAYRRNTSCTFADLTVPGYGLRFYVTEPADINLRVLVGCLDANGQRVSTLDNGVRVDGVFATLALPFADLVLPGTTTALELAAITGIQKDITLGAVSVYQVNLTTGAQTLLLQLEPGESIAAYSTYYLGSLPCGCCPSPGASGSVQVTAMVKLDLVPAVVGTDYLLIQSKEAIIAECQAARFGDMDSTNSKAMAAERHREAVRYLQGQLGHWEGKENTAVEFAPFGSARLVKQHVGLML